MRGSEFSRRCLRIAGQVLQSPTAPVHEEAVQSYLREFVRRRPQLTLRQDGAGNVVIGYSSRGAGRKAPLVMVAHMDHPGFWVEEVRGKTVELAFKGGVGKPHARVGTRVRFFRTGEREPIGSGRLTAVRYRKRGLFSATARIVDGAAEAGGLAMWDLPAFQVRKGLIVSRACDDLLGTAAALCALNEVCRKKPKGVAVQGLFTRSEELGFLGALEAVRLKTVPKNAVVLSLETSKALANAPQGNGVVVRVGDRASIFDPGLTGVLGQAARRLAETDRTFRWQRRLMDGGTCEATVFCAMGYRASGLALPLGNYHNQALGRGQRAQIGPETVSVSDFLCEIRLLVELALNPGSLHKPLMRQAWLKERMRLARRILRPARAGKKKGLLCGGDGMSMGALCM